jgi:hypothetical protein
MSEVKNQALPDRLQAHVMRLANTSMNLSLNDWGPIANDMLEAARLVSAPAPDVPVAEEIEAIRAQFEEASKLGGDPLWMKGHAVIGSLLALSDRLTVERNVLRRELAAHNEGRLGAMRLLDAAREELREVRQAAAPFLRDRAEIADGIPDDTSFSMVGFRDLGVAEFTVGDLRRLAAALKEKP